MDQAKWLEGLERENGRLKKQEAKRMLQVLDRELFLSLAEARYVLDQLHNGDLIIRDGRLCPACGPLGHELAVLRFAGRRGVLAQVEAVPVQLDEREIAGLASLFAVTGFAFGSCHGAAPML